MELKDTYKMMESEDFKERFRAEYFQAKIRAEKLAAMLEKYKADILPFRPNCSYELLFEQLLYMKQYLRILEERAEVENIGLEE